MEELNKYYQIAAIIREFLDKNIGEEERMALGEWLAEKEANRALFDELIKKENLHQDIAEIREIEGTKSASYERMRERLFQPGAKVILFRTRRWRRLVAACIILLIGAGGFFYVKHNIIPHRNSNTVVAGQYRNDVPPGGNKATLTLGDGSTIALDSAGNGALARQGNTNVLKPAAGQLAYNATGSTSPGEVFYNVLSTPRGGQFQVLLPDNSRVWLNAASSLRFPTAFTERERKVELQGEAYFEITKDPSRPFRVAIVRSFSGSPAKHDQQNFGEVEVVGTHFNVMAYDDERAISTTLLEGIVKVRKGTATTLLAPGEQAELDKSGIIKVIKNADMDGAIAWKNGLFNFRSANVQTIMRQIARWYDVQVMYEGKIPERKFTGEVPRSISLATLMRALELNDVHFRIEGRKIIVMQ